MKVLYICIHTYLNQASIFFASWTVIPVTLIILKLSGYYTLYSCLQKKAFSHILLLPLDPPLLFVSGLLNRNFQNHSKNRIFVNDL